MIVSSTDWDQGSISWTIVSANRQKDKMKTTTSSSDRDWRPQIKSFKSFSQTNNIISSWNSCLKFSFYHLVVACNSNFFCSAFEQNTQFDNISVYVCNSPIHISNSHFPIWSWTQDRQFLLDKAEELIVVSQHLLFILRLSPAPSAGEPKIRSRNMWSYFQLRKFIRSHDIDIIVDLGPRK